MIQKSSKLTVYFVFELQISVRVKGDINTSKFV